MIEKKDFKRGELPEKYMVKMLYRQDDGISEKVGEELAKIEVSFSRGETLKGG